MFERTAEIGVPIGRSSFLLPTPHALYTPTSVEHGGSTTSKGRSWPGAEKRSCFKRHFNRADLRGHWLEFYVRVRVPQVQSSSVAKVGFADQVWSAYSSTWDPDGTSLPFKLSWLSKLEFSL